MGVRFQVSGWMIRIFPLMLSVLKHSDPFSAT
jgi:hypothetical protein